MLFEGLAQHQSRCAVHFRTYRPPVLQHHVLATRPGFCADDDGKRIRYRYPTADDGRTLTFVGFQQPLPQIPAGTLLRVSLAHWWRPDEMPDGELRCYVQLSGWYEESYVSPAGNRRRLPPPLAFGTHDLTLAQAPAQLKRIFGYDDFRPLQARSSTMCCTNKTPWQSCRPAAVNHSVTRLPALLFPGLTVVVSPLISLMQDQVDPTARSAASPPFFLNSTLSYDGYCRKRSRKSGRTDETPLCRAGNTPAARNHAAAGAGSGRLSGH